MEQINQEQGGIQLGLRAASTYSEPWRCDDFSRPADHPDQLELDLWWPGVPRFEDVGRVSEVDVQIAGRFIIAMVEALDGRRPLAQLERRLDSRVYAAMQTHIRQDIAYVRPTRMRSLHTYEPAAGVIEACATLERADRVKALAARLQRNKPGWLCTAFRVL